MQAELQEAKAEIQTLRETVSSLQTRVDQGKDCIKQMWRENFRYVAEVDDELSRKDVEIQQLQEMIQELQAAATSEGGGMPHAASRQVRLGQWTQLELRVHVAGKHHLLIPLQARMLRPP